LEKAWRARLQESQTATNSNTHFAKAARCMIFKGNIFNFIPTWSIGKVEGHQWQTTIHGGVTIWLRIAY
jgi:hypothetical protein